MSDRSIAGECLDAIDRRRWAVLCLIALATGGTYWISSMVPRTYEATAVIEVVGIPADLDADEVIAAHARMLQSEAVLTPVAERFRLNDEPGDGPVRFRHLSVAREGASLVRVTYRHGSAETAASVTNGIAEGYVRYVEQVRTGAWSGISEAYRRQIEELERKARESAAELRSFNAGSGGTGDRGAGGIGRGVPGAAAPAGTRVVDVAVSEAGERDRLAPVETLRRRVLEERAEADRLVFEEASRKIGETENKSGLRNSYVRMVEPAHPEYRSAAPNVPWNCALALLLSTVTGCAGAIVVETRGGRIVTAGDLGAALARTASRSPSEAEPGDDRPASSVAAVLRRLNVRLLKIGDSREPWRDRRTNVSRLETGSQDEILPHIGTVNEREPIDDRLAGWQPAPQDGGRGSLSSQTGVERVIVLPRVQGWRGLQGLAMFCESSQTPKPGDLDLPQFREAVRALCNRLAREGRGRVVAVMSPAAGEGRSRIAMEIARAFTETGERALLIDANLRAPMLHALMFSTGPRHGLSTALAGETGWREVVAPVESADLLPSGAANNQTFELLRHAFRDIVEQARAEYGCVVVDSPPFLGCPESLDIAWAVDDIVVVARAGRTDVRELKTMLSYVERLGKRAAVVALNDARTRHRAVN